MKKIVLAVAIMLSACSKDFESAVQIESPTFRISHKSDPIEYADSVRAWYFEKATPELRLNYWRSKIQVDMDYMGFTDRQRNYVLLLFQHLEVESFTDGVRPGQQFTRWMNDWMFNARHFGIGRRQIGQIVFSLSPAPIGPSIGHSDACGCSEESDWCDFLNNGPSSSCSSACDYKKSRGCGTLLLYPCDKDCSF